MKSCGGCRKHRSTPPQLFEGMNVKVSICTVGNNGGTENCSGVADGKQVVFTVKDGKAIWNYVQTGLEISYRIYHHKRNVGKKAIRLLSAEMLIWRMNSPVNRYRRLIMIKAVLQRPVSILMLFLACVILGIITYFTLPFLAAGYSLPEITVQ